MYIVKKCLLILVSFSDVHVHIRGLRLCPLRVEQTVTYDSILNHFTFVLKSENMSKLFYG